MRKCARSRQKSQPWKRRSSIAKSTLPRAGRSQLPCQAFATLRARGRGGHLMRVRLRPGKRGRVIAAPGERRTSRGHQHGGLLARMCVPGHSDDRALIAYRCDPRLSRLQPRVLTQEDGRSCGRRQGRRHDGVCLSRAGSAGHCYVASGKSLLALALPEAHMADPPLRVCGQRPEMRLDRRLH